MTAGAVALSEIAVWFAVNVNARTSLSVTLTDAVPFVNPAADAVTMTVPLPSAAVVSTGEPVNSIKSRVAGMVTEVEVTVSRLGVPETIFTVNGCDLSTELRVTLYFTAPAAAFSAIVGVVVVSVKTESSSLTVTVAVPFVKPAAEAVTTTDALPSAAVFGTGDPLNVTDACP